MLAPQKRGRPSKSDAEKAATYAAKKQRQKKKRADERLATNTIYVKRGDNKGLVTWYASLSADDKPNAAGYTGTDGFTQTLADTSMVV